MALGDFNSNGRCLHLLGKSYLPQKLHKHHQPSKRSHRLRRLPQSHFPSTENCANFSSHCFVPPQFVGFLTSTLTESGFKTVLSFFNFGIQVYQSDSKNDRADAETLARVARMDARLLGPI